LKSAFTFSLAVALFVASAEAAETRVSVSFTPGVRKEPLSGRLLVAFAREGQRSPMDQTGSTGAPLFGIDVFDLAPGAKVTLDHAAFGHPIESLAALPKGKYQVQAFFNVYTRCERGDGHSILVHWDQGEGQNWRRSPGNLLSDPITVELDPAQGFHVEVECDDAIPAIAPIPDTDRVKRISVKSDRLSAFWGRDVFLGATVLLPKGFESDPNAKYPVLYEQGHFSRGAPGGYGRNQRFTDWWDAENTPRFLLVTFQHATPYYDDSYAVNSVNNGPYGDALVMDLIPEVEKRFRAIGAPWARTVTGGSTGGWECLALQIYYPDQFNGCWSLCPDSLDFRAHQIVNIYSDANAYFVDKGFTRVERPCRRNEDGSIDEMMKDENRYELVIGDKSRSGGQWDGWESVFSPVDDDGYPQRIWDKYSGAIDKDVATFWLENYDLRHIVEKNWAQLAPKLKGKLHVYVGEDDDYYLENGVRYFEAFVTKADPSADATFDYGSRKGHCYGPSLTELIPAMADWIASTAPAGADVTSWRPVVR
jgi:Putative esterase